MHWQLDWIYFIQHFRTPLLDDWFFFWNLFDSQAFFFIAIPILWLGVGWKWGVRCFYLFTFSSLLNYVLKMIFMTPRPFVLDPTLALIPLSDFGFPSGGAQTAILVAGLLIKELKHHFWGWFLGGNFFFWLSLSRLYLGLHFPMDLLGGWIVGILLLLLYYNVDPRIERWAKKKSWLSIFFWIAALSLLPPIFYYKKTVVLLSGVSLGVALSLYIAQRLHLLIDPKNFIERLVRVCVGVGGLYFVYFFFHVSYEEPLIFLWFQSLFFGLWIGTGAPWVGKKISHHLPIKKPLK